MNVPTGATGSTGATGATGDTGPGTIFIPFATGDETSAPRTNATGAPTEIQIVGFGDRSNRIPLSGNGFTLPTGNGVQFAFAIPRQAIVQSIYFTSSNWAPFTPINGAAVTPFVVLATAPLGSQIFTILENTQTIASSSWTGTGSQLPAGTTLSGFRTNINVMIPAGMRVAICCAYQITGNPSVTEYFFYYSGGILLS